jgi:hypothetical protein
MALLAFRQGWLFVACREINATGMRSKQNLSKTDSRCTFSFFIKYIYLCIYMLQLSRTKHYWKKKEKSTFAVAKNYCATARGSFFR